MRLLVDTHALVWFWVSPERLSVVARNALVDPANEAFVSAVSGYEIEFKRPRDPALSALPIDLEAAVVRSGFAWLAVTPSDAIAAGRLPRLHGDPWDRLLIAQALNHSALLVSADRRVAAYNSPLFW